MPTQQSPLNAKLQKAKSLLVGHLSKFIPVSQRAVIANNLRGEEREWFADKLIELEGIIEKMPVTYQTKGQGSEAVAHLHYFWGGSGNAWVTEKDVEGETPQAYGRQDLYGDGGSFGYICIDELVSTRGVELDLHWKAQPIKLCGKHGEED